MRAIDLKTLGGLILASSLLVGCGGSDSDDDSAGNDGTPSQPSEPAYDITRAHDYREFSVDEASLPFDPVTGYESTSRWHGVLDGAGYRVEVPAEGEWNGMLVMYAHGYRGEGSTLDVSNPSIREWLLENGYAWAASSYSANYYDVRAGVEDTNNLALNFTQIAADNGRTLSEPSKTYITGHSMGGHITAAAIEAETYATANNVVQYDGAVPMCGVTGGMYEFDYLSHFTFAAQHVAAQSDATLLQMAYPSQTFDATAINGILWNTAPSFTGQGDPTTEGERLEDVVERLSGGARPLYEVGFRGGYYNVVMGTGGRNGTVNGILARNAFGNLMYQYRYDSDAGDPLTASEQTFNNGIFRVMAHPEANSARDDGLRWIPRVNGEFSIPVVSIHGLGDLYVPFIHEQIYRQRAAANGNDQWLVQRAIRAPGHCDFTDQEQIDAFSAMVNWEQNGVRPDGDEILDAATVADPDYGCQFTTSDRTGLPACP